MSTAYLVTDANTLTPGQDAIASRLIDHLGFTLTRSAWDDLQVPLLQASDVVVLHSRRAPAELVGATVPVVVCRPEPLFAMAMIAASPSQEFGATANRSGSIRSHSHPVACGLTGNVELISGGQGMAWGRPGDHATNIVSVAGDGDESKSMVFAYEKGAMMPGLHAPAGRLAFLAVPDEPDKLTEQGWTIFDASVRWCLLSAAATKARGEPEHPGKVWFMDDEPTQVLSIQEYRNWVQEQVARRLLAVLSAVGVGGIVMLATAGSWFIDSTIGKQTAGLEKQITKQGTDLETKLDLKVDEAIDEARDGLYKRIEGEIATTLMNQEAVREALEKQAAEVAADHLDELLKKPETETKLVELAEKQLAKGGFERMIRDQLVKVILDGESDRRRVSAIKTLAVFDTNLETLHENLMSTLKRHGEDKRVVRAVLTEYEPVNIPKLDGAMLLALRGRVSDLLDRDEALRDDPSLEGMGLELEEFIGRLSDDHARAVAGWLENTHRRLRPWLSNGLVRMDGDPPIVELSHLLKGDDELANLALQSMARLKAGRPLSPEARRAVRLNVWRTTAKSMSSDLQTDPAEALRDHAQKLFRAAETQEREAIEQLRIDAESLGIDFLVEFYDGVLGGSIGELGDLRREFASEDDLLRAIEDNLDVEWSPPLAAGGLETRELTDTRGATAFVKLLRLDDQFEDVSDRLLRSMPVDDDQRLVLEDNLFWLWANWLREQQSASVADQRLPMQWRQLLEAVMRAERGLSRAGVEHAAFAAVQNADIDTARQYLREFVIHYEEQFPDDGQGSFLAHKSLGRALRRELRDTQRKVVAEFVLEKGRALAPTHRHLRADMAGVLAQALQAANSPEERRAQDPVRDAIKQVGERLGNIDGKDIQLSRQVRFLVLALDLLDESPEQQGGSEKGRLEKRTLHESFERENIYAKLLEVQQATIDRTLLEPSELERYINSLASNLGWPGSIDTKHKPLSAGPGAPITIDADDVKSSGERWYEIEVEQGVEYLFEPRYTPEVPGTNPSLMIVSDDQKEVLLWENIGRPTDGALEELEPPKRLSLEASDAGGTRYLRARLSAADTPFEINIRSRRLLSGADTATDAPEVAFDDVYAVKLEPNEIQWAMFEAVAGRTYEIETASLSEGADTILYLYQGDSEQADLVDDDSGPEALASRIVWDADRNVPVQIAVEDVNEQAGQFDLVIRESDTPPRVPMPQSNTRENATEISFDAVYTVALGADQTQWATFEAVAGRTYEIETTSLTEGADTILYLYYSDSEEPDLVDDDGGPEPLASGIAWYSDRDVPVRIAVTDVNAQAVGFNLVIRETVE